MRLLLPQNRKVLAYLREHEDDTILCVVNVSRSAQSVELDLSEFTGRTPVELLGGTPFPADRTSPLSADAARLRILLVPAQQGGARAGLEYDGGGSSSSTRPSFCAAA